MKSCALRGFLLAGLVLASAARADITVGVDIATTGPAAAIGIPTKNVVMMWPQTLGGQKAHYVILDDGSDPTNTVTNVRKLTSEQKIDVLVGPNTTPAALAVLDVIAESKTPMVALAANASIIEPHTDPKRKWAFKMPQNDSLMASAIVGHMARAGVKSVGFIGFNDSYGESWWNEFSPLAAKAGIKVVANERYNRTDTSVTGQVLKIMMAKPHAVLVAASSTPALLPQKTLVDRGYRGKMYQTHGIATPEFLRLGGKTVEGTLFPTGPGVVAHGLPDSHPVKKVAVEFVDRYEAKFGPGSVTQFAGDAWGAWMLLDDAVRRALQKGAKPGTPEFRAALRDAIESTSNLTVPNGVLNLKVSDHQGFDERSRVMGIVRDGKFAYEGEGKGK